MFGRYIPQKYLTFLCTFLGLAIFFLDLFLPLGVAAGVPYVAVVLLALWSSSKSFVLSVGVYCTVLTVLGHILSPGAGGGVAAANRFLALFAIWAGVGLGLLRTRADIAHKSYSDLVHSIQMGLYVYRLENTSDVQSLRLIAANPASARLTGIPEIEAKGKLLRDVFPDLSRTQIPELFAGVVKKGKPVEVENFYYGDERVISAAWSFKAFPMPDRCVAVAFENITARKEIEEKLRENQRTLDELVGNFPGMAYQCKNDPEWSVKYISRGCQELTGYPPSSFLKGDLSYTNDVIHPDDQERVWEQVQEAVQERRAFRLAYRIRTAEGSERWVWEQGKGVYSKKGAPLFLEGFISDITERRKAEDLLYESQARLKAQYRGIPIPTISWQKADGDFVLTDYNEAMEETMGVSIRELLGQQASEVYSGRQDILDKLNQSYTEKRVIRHEIKFQYPSSPYLRDLSVTYVFVPPDLVMMHSEDISERKSAEAEIHRSHETFRFLASYNEKVSGLGVEEVAKKTLEFISGRLGFARCSVALWDEKGGEFRLLRTLSGEGAGFGNGTTIPVKDTVLSEMIRAESPRYRPDIRTEASGYPADEILLSAGILSDYLVPLRAGNQFLGTLNVASNLLDGLSLNDRYYITLLGPRLAQGIQSAGLVKNLAKSQESLSKAQRIAHIGNWDWDIQANELAWSDEIYRIFGLEPQQFGATYEAFMESVHPEDREAVKSAVHEALFEFKPYSIAHRVIRRDGAERVVQEQAEVIFDEGKNPLRMIGTVQDITEWRKAEEAILESERRFRELGELLPEAVFETDENGFFRYINRKMAGTFGLSGAHPAGQPWEKVNLLEVISPEDGPRAREDLRRVMAGTPLPANEYTAIGRAGRKIPIGWNLSAIHRDGKPVGIRGVIVDMTIFKRNEKEILRAQKLESLGVLAGGIAHDFNNLLTGVLGNISIALDPANPKESQKALKRAEAAIKRARGLTHQLVTFSKGGGPVKKRLSLKNLVKDAVTFGLTGSGLKPVFSIPDGIHEVDADPAQINQVFHNLALNASQATPGPGRLWVDAKNTVLSPLQNPSVEPGRYVEVLVRDEGTGISDEILSKIFDPYFSTKKGGTGLGLAMAYSIIKNHSGLIDVKSAEGEGTIFRVCLPAARRRATPKRTGKRSGKRFVPKILFMDDESDIRTFVEIALRKEGMKVDCVETGEEAIRLFEKARKKKPYDLVILDLTVRGGMGGKETLERLRAVEPDVPAVVCSGYSDNPVMSDPLGFGLKGVIPKPFSPGELVDKIRNVVDMEKD